MKVLFFTICSLIALNGFCQKYIEIPDNGIDSVRFNNIKEGLSKFSFDDLTTSSDSLRIRIWMRHNIVELKYGDNISAQLTSWIYPYNSNGKPIIHSRTFDFKTSKILLDSLIFYNALDLEDEQFIGIDGTNYMFEISTPNKYRLYSYWSPTLTRSQNSKNAVILLNLIRDILYLNVIEYAFIESLEPGIYKWGMSTIEVDNFISEQDNRSSLYEFIEDKMRKELAIDEHTCRTEFPLIMIDDKRCFLNDINKYEYSQIDDITFITRNDYALAVYGTRGENGVILIKTK